MILTGYIIPVLDDMKENYIYFNTISKQNNHWNVMIKPIPGIKYTVTYHIVIRMSKVATK